MAKKTTTDTTEAVIEQVIESEESMEPIIEQVIEPEIRMSADEFAEQNGRKPSIVRAVKTLDPIYKEHLSAKEWKDIFDALMVKPVSVKWDNWLNEFKTRRNG